jgi:hypothetical protein
VVSLLVSNESHLVFYPSNNKPRSRKPALFKALRLMGFFLAWKKK